MLGKDVADSEVNATQLKSTTLSIDDGREKELPLQTGSDEGDDTLDRADALKDFDNLPSKQSSSDTILSDSVRRVHDGLVTSTSSSSATSPITCDAKENIPVAQTQSEEKNAEEQEEQEEQEKEDEEPKKKKKEAKQIFPYRQNQQEHHQYQQQQQLFYQQLMMSHSSVHPVYHHNMHYYNQLHQQSMQPMQQMQQTQPMQQMHQMHQMQQLRSMQNGSNSPYLFFPLQYMQPPFTTTASGSHPMTSSQSVLGPPPSFFANPYNLHHPVYPPSFPPSTSSAEVHSEDMVHSLNRIARKQRRQQQPPNFQQQKTSSSCSEHASVTVSNNGEDDGDDAISNDNDDGDGDGDDDGGNDDEDRINERGTQSSQGSDSDFSNDFEDAQLDYNFMEEQGDLNEHCFSCWDLLSRHGATRRYYTVGPNVQFVFCNSCGLRFNRNTEKVLCISCGNVPEKPKCRVPDLKCEFCNHRYVAVSNEEIGRQVLVRGISYYSRHNNNRQRRFTSTQRRKQQKKKTQRPNKRH